MKLCKTCDTEKEDDEFYKHHSKGLQSQCKSCKAEYNRQHYKKDKDSYLKRASAQRGTRKYQESTLQRRYGISLEFYEEMLKSQNGVCAICKEDTTLCVDHCHSSGKVRGLLCHMCNKGLGHFKDRKDFLEKAALYLTIK